QCKSNLKNLGLAMHNYADKQRVLPFGYGCGEYQCAGGAAGGGGGGGGGGAGGGCVPDTFCQTEGNPSDFHWSGWAMIMPELEETNTFSDMNFRLHRLAPENTTVTAKAVAVFICPSQMQTQKVREYEYNQSSPPSSWAFLGLAGPTSYRLSMAGAASGTSQTDFDYNNGVFYRNSRVGMAELSGGDGTSYTIFAGEVARDQLCGPQSPPGLIGCGYRDNGFSALSRTFQDTELNKSNTRFDADGDGNLDTTTYSYWSSNHGGTVQFVMGDGSVRGISQSVDGRVMRALATRAGRETISNEEF
ncbi:MAG: DUF1559 domain-containing protein, partial [Planctomycetia bacterium]